MDKNNDGTISREELLESKAVNYYYKAYSQIYDPQKAEDLIDEILKSVDINNSG
jgi:Ca2+-binding EF-hand superfamily protein